MHDFGLFHCSVLDGHMFEKYQRPLSVVTSGIAAGLCIYHIWYWLIWMALTPFLFAIDGQSKKQSFLYGLLFGTVEGSILLWWIIESTQRYTDSSTWLGVPIFVATVLWYSLFPAVFACLFSILSGDRAKRSSLFSVLTSASVWIVLEWTNVNVLAGLPWVKYTLGFTQANHLYGLQFASIGGQWGISFFVVLVNLLLVQAVRTKKTNRIWISAAMVLLFYGAGFLLVSAKEDSSLKRVKVAVIQENISAETRWQESTGDQLAGILFDLNRQAMRAKPDIIVWSETALPWTFTPDDPLIRKALEITREVNASHLIGMLSQVEKGSKMVRNSAFYIEPGGRVSDRYDKQELLSFLEEPLLDSSLKIPFFSDGIDNIERGSDQKPFHTPDGRIGVLICNETLLPYLSKDRVLNGAQLLINLSNDGWLEGTRLVDHHFYYTRMRAVETGRDIVINSNRGHSAIISANGKIEQANISESAKCLNGEVRLRSRNTVYTRLGDWTIYVAVFLIAVNCFLQVRRRYVKE